MSKERVIKAKFEVVQATDTEVQEKIDRAFDILFDQYQVDYQINYLVKGQDPVPTGPGR